MASEKQIEANRINAQKSTGPRTEEGKRQTSLNALSHGLRAESIHVLPHEDSDEYDRRLRAWYDEYDPRSEEENLLVEYAAAVSWKIIRADRYEAFHLAQRTILAAEPFFKADHDTLEEAVILASFDPSNEGERLRRYQFSLHRELRRTLERLAKLRDQRAKQSNEKVRPDSVAAPSGMLSLATPVIPDFLEELAPPPHKSQKRQTPTPKSPSTPRNYPNKANFGRPSALNPAKKVIDLDQDFSPLGVKCTPFEQISCLKS